jgi:hypothetical protein
MELIEQQLTDLSAELKTFAAKAQDETKSIGAMATETKTALGTIQAKIAELQTQVDAIDAKGQHRHVPGNASSKRASARSLTAEPKYLEAEEYAASRAARRSVRTRNPSAFTDCRRKTEHSGERLQPAEPLALITLRSACRVSRDSRSRRCASATS